MTPSQELLAALKSVGGYLMTAKKVNTKDWLDGIQERIDLADAAISNFESAGEGETRWRVDRNYHDEGFLRGSEFAGTQQDGEHFLDQVVRLEKIISARLVRLETYTTVVATRSGKEQ